MNIGHYGNFSFRIEITTNKRKLEIAVDFGTNAHRKHIQSPIVSCIQLSMYYTLTQTNVSLGRIERAQPTLDR